MYSLGAYFINDDSISSKFMNRGEWVPLEVMLEIYKTVLCSVFPGRYTKFAMQIAPSIVFQFKQAPQLGLKLCTRSDRNYKFNMKPQHSQRLDDEVTVCNYKLFVTGIFITIVN